MCWEGARYEYSHHQYSPLPSRSPEWCLLKNGGDNFGSVTEFAYLRQTIGANMRTEGRLVSFPSFSLSHSKILAKFARGTGILTTRMCLCRG